MSRGFKTISYLKKIKEIKIEEKQKLRNKRRKAMSADGIHRELMMAAALVNFE